MKKVYPDAKTALDGILKDGMVIMSGGFGLCGIPETLSDAIREAGHAVTHGEVDAGVWGASAPVLASGRRLRGAITLMAPLTRVEGMEAALLHMTVVTAARISRALQ